MSEAKPSIRDYSDYRRYLNDMYEYRKNRNVRFSFQYMAQKTKTSRSYLKNVIDGRRHLSMDKIAPLAQIFGLEGFEFDYLIILVLENSSEDQILKERFGYILRGLRGALQLVPKHFEMMQDEGGDYCLTSTLGGAIYALAEAENFQFKRDWIHGHLVNKDRYSLDEVESVMNRLLELGLLVEENGCIKQGKPVSGVITPYSPRDGFRMYRPTAIKLYEVLDDVPAHGYIRVMSAKLAVGDKELAEVEAEFDRFKDRIEAISSSAKEPNRVMGFVNSIYPIIHIK